jgi:preprotein translocase subunit YajC
VSLGRDRILEDSMFLQAGAGQGGMASAVVIWVVLLGVMYFMMIRPQQQQQRKRREMLQKVKRGDRVVTIGGIHAVVADVHDDALTLELAPNVKVRADRSAVGSIRGRKPEGGKSDGADREKVKGGI